MFILESNSGPFGCRADALTTKLFQRFNVTMHCAPLYSTTIFFLRIGIDNILIFLFLIFWEQSLNFQTTYAMKIVLIHFYIHKIVICRVNCPKLETFPLEGFTVVNDISGSGTLRHVPHSEQPSHSTHRIIMYYSHHRYVPLIGVAVAAWRRTQRPRPPQIFKK